MVGYISGKLVVTSFAHKKGRRSFWNCKCSCGGEKIVGEWSLKYGTCRSCGCLRGDNRQTHGMQSPDKNKAYFIWKGMRRRCSNPGCKSYERYGGRGITVCDRWEGSFANFFEDMGPPPVKTSLDRIDNDKGYSPDNCRWATAKEQSANTSKSVNITFRGETQTIRGWARSLGITHPSLRKRLARWTLEEALSTPANTKRHSNG